MVAGQTRDLEGVPQDKEELKLLDSLKTGAMCRAAAELGCIAAGADREAQRQASEYAAHLGLAFQVRDDMLDVTAGEEELGKNTGSDQASGKRTYVNLLGLKGCEALAAEETNLAKAMIGDGWQGAFLRELADSLLSRSN